MYTVSLKMVRYEKRRKEMISENKLFLITLSETFRWACQKQFSRGTTWLNIEFLATNFRLEILSYLNQGIENQLSDMYDHEIETCRDLPWLRVAIKLQSLHISCHFFASREEIHSASCAVYPWVHGAAIFLPRISVCLELIYQEW